MQNGADDGGGDGEARRNGSEGEEVEGKQEGAELNPKPFNKLRYKIAKLNSDENEENEATASSAAQEESPKTPDSPLSLDESSENFLSGFFDKWRALRKMKKFQTRPRTTAEEVVDVTKIPSPPPRAPPVGPKGGINFGPFSPIGSNRQSSDSKKSTINFEVKSPVEPRSVRKPVRRPLGLLAPHQTTYLRARPPELPAVYAADPDPNTPMGPPESKIIRTPYETVKKALTFLKSELGLTTYTSSPQAEAYEEDLAAKNGLVLQTAPPRRLPSYSLSKISPNMGLSVEEVIMELEEYLSSMPETTSSTAMKSNLMKFQMKLGMPPWPAIYNLMWQSAMAFLKHLAKYFPHDSWDDTFLASGVVGGLKP